MTEAAPRVERELRVLEVLGNAIVGGMETYVARLVDHLRAAGVAVACVCPFESPLTTHWRDTGLAVSIARMPDDPAWSAVQLVATLVRERRIDVVHCHLANAHLLGALAGRLAGVPVLATIHGRHLAPLDLEVQRLAGTTLVVVCESARLHALALGVPRERVFWVPNGVDVSAYALPARPRYLHELLALAPTTRLVGFVGRLSPEKGPEAFVRAAAVAHGMGSDAHFVLVGEGPLAPALQRAAAQAGLAKRLHFTGALGRMPEVFGALSCVVSSSHSEGMPLALMEAMAAGCPVVATHVGGTAELVEQGETGYLVAAGDYEGIARHVVTMLADEKLRARLGSAARRRAATCFPFAKSATAVERLLRALARRERVKTT